MSRPAPKSRRRKALNTSEEEFFERVLFLWGPPTPEFVNYQDQFSRGIANWLKRSANGQKFMELLVAHGEAKTRAPKMYSRYMGWYNRERNKT